VKQSRRTSLPARTINQSSKNEMATIKAFKKKFGIIVKPNVGVLTFNKWIGQAFVPKRANMR
jgi:hypothetical protein